MPTGVCSRRRDIPSLCVNLTTPPQIAHERSGARQRSMELADGPPARGIYHSASIVIVVIERLDKLAPGSESRFFHLQDEGRRKNAKIPSGQLGSLDRQKS